MYVLELFSFSAQDFWMVDRPAYDATPHRLTRGQARKGRGAASNAPGRFEPHTREAVADGWEQAGSEVPEEAASGPLRTTVLPDQARRVIARNNSPDIPFDRSINPYRGCEHGCIYCYARPSHAYLGLSPGLDFETRLFAKMDGVARLRAELAKPGYVPAPIAFGANTDPYQPVERRLGITRGLIELLSACQHPITIVTKSDLVTRDIELLKSMAERRLVQVFVSITTLDRGLARTLEPRAATPSRRLAAVSRLVEAGVPAGVMTAPIIPAVTDHEIEALLEAAAEAGAYCASYTLLRLPHEVKELFDEWLRTHAPLKREKVLNLIRDTRAGGLNDSAFGRRLKGEGPYAQLIAARHKAACRRFGLTRPMPDSDCTRFRPRRKDTAQLDLF